MAETKYAAFISYSHKDEAVAKWLHGRLERYAIPRGVAPDYGCTGLFGRRIGRVFRDREELPAGYPLTETINEALARSDSLVVLCSPHASKSEYVQKEIVEFQRLGKGDRIFPVIVSGNDHEIFLPALSEKREILEADLRPDKDGRNQAVIKLLAGLMRLEPYDLASREVRAQRVRLVIATAIVLICAALIAAVALFSYKSWNAQRETERTINRFFLTSSDRALESREPFRAMRFILAGYQLSVDNKAAYDAALSNVYSLIGNHMVFNSPKETSASAVSANGKLLLSAGSYSQLQLWNVETGTLIRGFRNTALPLRVVSVIFSPDGHRAVATGDNTDEFRGSLGALACWDVETGQLVWETTVHDGTIVAIAFSSDGTKLAIGGYAGFLSLRDVHTGSAVGSVMTGHGGSISALTFSLDGSVVASGSDDGTTRLWDVVSGKQVGAPFRGRSGPIYAVALSPDGTKIISASRDGPFKLWDIADRGRTSQEFRGSNSDRSVAFLPDGKHVVSSNGRYISTWDVDSHKRITVLSPLTGNFSTPALALQLDDHRFFAIAEHGNLRLWDAWIPRQYYTPMTQINNDIAKINFSADRRRIASGDFDGNVKLWDSTRGRTIIQTQISDDGAVAALAMSPDGTRVAAAASHSADGHPIIKANLTFWDIASGQKRIVPIKEGNGIAALAFSPDGERVASGDDRGNIILWDARTGMKRDTPLSGHGGQIRVIAFSPDGHRIVSGSVDNRLMLWDVNSGKRLGVPLAGHSDSIEAIAFSPDGHRIASGSVDESLRLWDADTGAQIASPLVGHKGAVLSVAFSPDGRRLASGSNDQQLLLWDALTGRRIGAPFGGRDGAIYAVAFSSDGRRVVSAANEKLRVWDVTRLVQPWQIMAREICLYMLGPSGRTFSRTEIEADPFLFGAWSDPNRDVCGGIPGVPPLSPQAANR